MGAAEYSGMIGRFLEEDNWGIRATSAAALAALGARQYKQRIRELIALRTPYTTGWTAAFIIALGELGDTEYAPEIARLINSKDLNLAMSSQIALGSMRARQYAPQLARLIGTDSEYSVTYQALGQMDATEYASQVRGHIRDLNFSQAPVASWALETLPLDNIVHLLQSPSYPEQIAAVEALRHVKARAAAQQIAQLLTTKTEPPYSDTRPFSVTLGPGPEHTYEPNARSVAIAALGAIGAREYLPAIAKFVNDSNPYTSASAITALGDLGATSCAAEIARTLKGGTVDSSLAAVTTLCKLNAKQFAPELLRKLPWILSQEQDGTPLADSLIMLGPFTPTMLCGILAPSYEDRNRVHYLQALSHVLGGGRTSQEIVTKWLAKPNAHVGPNLSRAAGLALLAVFHSIWGGTIEYPDVQNALAERAAEVARAVRWEPRDLSVLAGTLEDLRSKRLTQADAVDRVRVAVQGWSYCKGIIASWMVQVLFWAFLLLLYPHFPRVQAFVFWNPWARRILGWGYVGVLLAHVPPLRRRLFAPFRELLVQGAHSPDSDETPYFADSQVRKSRLTVPVPLSSALPEIHGQIVLEGDSGLGKSMFLRRLVRSSRRIAVFLSARSCAAGVVEAIPEKLHGQANDEAFLKTLIYIGAMDICIDDLNEAVPDTRARIGSVAESYSNVNLILATQPIEWTPPPLATVFELQPLSDAQIETFLLTRSDIRASAAASGVNYDQGCRDFLRAALATTTKFSAWSRKVVTNPMDLTLAARMIAQGLQPNLINLHEQQYRIMADDYSRVNAGAKFPLERFSEHVYEMRVQDRDTISPDFSLELQSLQRHKMAVCRYSVRPEGKADAKWFFRHDRFGDFFVVQAFLGRDNPLPAKHLSDPRFRGVYLLLATLLPSNVAQELREQLILHAAETKDHSLSDAFVQLLRISQIARGDCRR